jgi:phosphatidylglycerophosphatase A
MSAVARAIAGGLGCGRAPLAPGTVASAATLLPGGLLLHYVPSLLAATALLVTLLGLWAIRCTKVEGDPGWVVIDEVAGQLLALCGLAQVTWAGLLAAFLLFRLLDVVKPGPVGWADRQGGASGIMADDVIAGGVAAGILWAARTQWPDLLG